MLGMAVLERVLRQGCKKGMRAVLVGPLHQVRGEGGLCFPRAGHRAGPGPQRATAGLGLCLYTSLLGKRKRWKWVESLDKEEEISVVGWTSE